MARATIVFGVGLILVGVFTYLATGGARACLQTRAYCLA